MSTPQNNDELNKENQNNQAENNNLNNNPAKDDTLNKDDNVIQDDTQNKDDNVIQDNTLNTDNIADDLDKSNDLNKTDMPNKKVSLKEMLSNKRVRYGAYSSVMTIAVIAIIVVLNLVISQFDFKIDLTTEKMFSLSDQTKQIVSSLNKDVDIYTTYATGNENIQFVEMLDKYKGLSNKIKITNKDPNLNPTFMQKYMEDERSISAGSIIVESGNRFKVLSSYDLVDYQPNYQTYQNEVTGIALEQKVTSAIQYVTTDNLPIAYIIEGHNEFELDSTVQDSLANENYELKNLNILTQGSIPDDASLLIINSPARDYSQDEAKILIDYLNKGGKAIFILNFYNDEKPNYESVLASYGVKPQNLVVLEGNQSNCLPNNPLYLLPNIENHDITKPLVDNKLNIILPYTQAIENLQQKNANTKITPLLTTSNSAYAKVNNESTIAKESGDIEGPFNLAVLIEDNWFNDSESYQSKVVVISSPTLFDSGTNQISSGANLDFFMNTVNFLVDRQDSISIRSKSLATEYLQLDQTQALIIIAIALIIIPIIIFAIGIVIWLRRKNK